MARILCAMSGEDLRVDHFPVYLTARECYHPLFTMNKKKLLAFAGEWAELKLTPTENYLYYLALLHSTGLVEFRVPAIKTGLTQSIIATNMEALLHVVGKMDITYHPNFNPPHFVISQETKDLSCTGDWIKVWNDNYLDFQSGYKTATHVEKVNRREAALEKLIKDKTRSVESYAGILSEWAALAGNFPMDEPAGLSKDILGGKDMSLGEYWKVIIRKCAKADSIFEIPDADIDELIEHCEDHIDMVSSGIFSHTLLAFLREGKKRKSNFLDLGDFEVVGGGYKILSPSTSIEDANKFAMIQNAPSEQPRLEQYPNKLAYLKAKLAYDMAKTHREAEAKQLELDTKINTGNITLGDL